MSEKIIAAIIAGVISIIGIIVNLYLNIKSNKDAVRKMKVEFQLEKQKKINDKFREFAAKVEGVIYELNLVKFRIRNYKPDGESKLELSREVRESCEKLINSWLSIKYEMGDLEMNKSKKIGMYIHDEVSQGPIPLIHQLQIVEKQKSIEKKDLDNIINLIEHVQGDLESLIDMLLLEKKHLREQYDMKIIFKNQCILLFYNSFPKLNSRCCFPTILIRS